MRNKVKNYSEKQNIRKQLKQVRQRHSQSKENDQSHKINRQKRNISLTKEQIKTLDDLRNNPNSLINQSGRKFTPVSSQTIFATKKTTFSKFEKIDKYYQNSKDNYKDDIPFDLYNMVN